MGYNYDSANYAGQFVGKLPFPCSRVEIRQKRIETKWGRDARFYNNGRRKDRFEVGRDGWRLCSPSSRENAPAYFQPSNLN